MSRSSSKLRISLSAILRGKPRFTAACFFSGDSCSASRIDSSPIYFSALSPAFVRVLRSRSIRDSENEILGGARFFWRGFCSQSVEIDGTGKCWNCGAVPHTRPFLACDSCRSIQPVDHSVDYFQIFDLEKKYEIGEANLEGKYKDWQKKLHPDLVHSKSKEEREYAAEQSARVIDAYRTLSKPLSRAIYVLESDGVEVDEEETVSEMDLLSEIMEIREAVEEASDSQALNEIQLKMNEKLKHWSDKFASSYQSQNFKEAESSIRRMRYYERVSEEITKKL